MYVASFPVPFRVLHWEKNKIKAVTHILIAAVHVNTLFGMLSSSEHVNPLSVKTDEYDKGKINGLD